MINLGMTLLTDSTTAVCFSVWEWLTALLVDVVEIGGSQHGMLPNHSWPIIGRIIPLRQEIGQQKCAREI